MKKVLIFKLILLLFSCHAQRTENNVFSKNKKLYDKLYQTNGNIFTLGILNFDSSYIWSYTKNNIVVYNLVQGKIISEKIIQLKNKDHKWLLSPSKDDLGIDQCITTDGSILMYKIKNKTSFIEKRFPITLDCMKNGVYETDFFKNLIIDVNFYDIGWKKLPAQQSR
jgi:hypothetical protein